MSVECMNDMVKRAISNFWEKRDGGKGVQSGKTLDSFLKIIERVVKENGLDNAEIHTGKNAAQLPGFFRPHKAWDVVVINGKQLVAAIEFKSQVGSIGNNFNNRSEEVLGSSIDLKTAIEELAFGEDASIFTGYIIVVEKSDKTLATPTIGMKYFPVMSGFLLDENERGKSYKINGDGVFPRAKGISYLSRYDIMCKRLMIKGLYQAAAVVAAPNCDHIEGNYESVSPQTSIETFFMRLASHCQVIASINDQKNY